MMKKQNNKKGNIECEEKRKKGVKKKRRGK